MVSISTYNLIVGLLIFWVGFGAGFTFCWRRMNRDDREE